MGESARGHATIWVVDDNALTRALLADALRSAGYEPVEFASAQKALEAIGGDVPAACVVDHTMPGISGAEFIRTIRKSADAEARSLPLIGVSASFADDLVAAGADACIAKPFSDKSVSGAVAAAMSARAAAPGAAPRPGSLADFRRLHERARAGSLGRSDLLLYRSLRTDLERAFLAMQHMALPPGSRARRALRAAAHLRVDLHVGGQPVHAHTVDIGHGGFSVVLASAPAVGARIGFRMELGEREWIEGTARVANALPPGPHGGGAPDARRVGFTFVNVEPDQLDRIEMRVFDAMVEQLEAAQR